VSIEETVVAFLSQHLEEPVGAEVPSGPPDSFVVVEKTGSHDDHSLLTAMIAVQSTAPSMVGAIGLNSRVKTAMRLLTTLPNVFRCHCETDHNFSDPRTKSRRYQAIFEIVYKE
jgi:hypothetical protein